MKKRAILHIPHAEMLVTQSVQYWVERFEKYARTPPGEVVLPAIGYLGPTFEPEVYAHATSLRPGNLFSDWINQVRKLLGNDVPIWASMIPTYSFLEAESLMIQDQYGSRLSQACITNSTVQKITDKFLNEIAEWNVHGIVFDLTDIYPNSRSNSLKGIQNTCFCNYCLKQLEDVGWKDGCYPFTNPNNISRFVLHVTETGASQIQAHHEWLSNIDTRSLIQYAKARGFVSEQDDNLEDAEKLLRYLVARGEVTATSVRRLGLVARNKDLVTAVILVNQHFDMTQSTDLASLFAAEAAKEYWLPSVDNILQPRGTIIQYLFSKATYGLNAFFEVLGDADNIIATIGVSEFIERLLHQSARIRSNKLNPGAIAAVELADEYAGFVGVPLGSKDIIRYIDELRNRGILGLVMPGEVFDAIVEQIRLTSPEKS